MRATVIQFQAGADKPANLDAAAALIGRAVSADRPDLVSLPEMWTCLGADRATKHAMAEPLPAPGAPGQGSAWRFLSETARAHAITLHGGSIGELADDKLYNTSLVFGPDGQEIARYRKIHLFDITTPSGQGYRESSLFGAGTAPVIARLAQPRATLGLTICYDLRFPELYLALRRAGADILVVPSAFTAETGRDHWEVLLRARAIETQSFVIAAATCGQHEDASGRARSTWGHAMIIDPWGRILTSLADTPGFATAMLDLDALPGIRDAMPVLQHRRLA